ncbi:MAG TPA: cation-translocating P-type ATPase [Pirellulales bacterium]|nr:cation-translocating P-type ATPase [Pirellulales bacterium]
MNASGATTSSSFYVPALDCPEEFSLIEKGLRRLEGVVDLTPDYLNRRLAVEYDAPKLDALTIAARIRQIGFEAEVVSHEAVSHRTGGQAPRPYLRRTTLAGAALLGLAFAASFVFSSPVPGDMLAVAATLAAGLSVARAGWRAVRLRALDMNALMTLAACGALATGDYFEAATAMVLFGVSLWLESYSLTRARRAVRSLVELVPPRAHRYDGEATTDVDAADLKPGDRLLVKPGERVPVDGEVEQGTSSVNQAPITGESMPVEKGPGHPVYAGSVNGEGALVVRASRAAADSTLAHIARLVEEAQRGRSPTERFVDRFARYYTPAVIGLALALVAVPLAATTWHVSWAEAHPPLEWLHRALVLLVIACPCALVISTPVTIVCGLQAAARQGMLIKGGEFLERAGRIASLGLDKTGTLTPGRAAVSKTIPAPGVSAEELLRVAAAVESRSEHPLALAIIAAAGEQGVAWQPAGEVSALRGFGVRGQIDGEPYFVGNWSLFSQPPLAAASNRGPADAVRRLGESLLAESTATIVFVGSPARFLGALAIEDRARPEAKEALDELRQLRVRPIVLLSGDRKAVVRQMAKELGIRDFHADLLPQEKVDQIKVLMVTHPHMAMVGDGVNDAPALAASWLGIAFGSQASDTALETADVVILSSRLILLPQLVRLGRRTRSILTQNITLALGIKGAVLLAAVAGPEPLARLWLAVAADVGATLLVVANGMRLLR